MCVTLHEQLKALFFVQSSADSRDMLIFNHLNLLRSISGAKDERVSALLLPSSVLLCSPEARVDS